MLNRYRLDTKSAISLQDIDPNDTAPFQSKEEVAAEIAELKERLQEAQEKLFAGKSRGVLILFQGMDCSGKDGVINKVLSGLNPQGFRAESFKQPTTEESAHDFLWRTHKLTPAKGYIAAFNRSYYEDVLITRVHGTIDKKEATSRLKHIQNFEKLLADSGVVLVKIFLHISKDFQLKKIRQRLENPEKRWKFDPSDLAERKHWDAYAAAYEDAFRATGTKRNPWYVVPANRRWFRDYLVLRILVSVFDRMELSFPEVDLASLGPIDEADLQ
ncbi:PPK2 family polyphosphate kinase [Cohnella nanjingensis]|uniref:Polyphosphate kinase 2 family protein n=1 Tax=Cohnella nanjingensis TaxID=1387779 RepID=A0A7X0RQ76_9BACL|nr:PPK2 family polyphosphate kinase [Cohnella nanjingensis]MBB6671555.1 polyphosphate kinase 2 family protein [Cohnella nanjingensis]